MRNRIPLSLVAALAVTPACGMLGLDESDPSNSRAPIEGNGGAGEAGGAGGTEPSTGGAGGSAHGGAGGLGGEGGSGGGEGGAGGSGGVGGVGGSGGVVACTDTEILAPGPGKIDVLWVIDNSSGSEISALQITNRFAQVLGPMLEAEVKFQIGVTTTGLVPAGGCPGGVLGGEDGRLFPVDGSRPRIVRPTTTDYEAVLTANTEVGPCHGTEMGLEASYRALTSPLIDHADDPRHPEPWDGNLGFLRDDAHLNVLYLGDEDDQSPETVAFYADALRAVKGGDAGLVSAVAVVGEKGGCENALAGDRFLELVDALGGLSTSFCGDQAAWDTFAEEYGELLMRRAVPLVYGPISVTPSDTDGDGSITEADLELSVGGNVVPAVAQDGAVNWRYDPQARKVTLASQALPGDTEQVRVTYGCD